MNRSREYALALLEKARGDLYVLERLAPDADAPAWSLGFHAQQAAEKSAWFTSPKHRVGTVLRPR
jgi:hypothetical protein